MKTHGKKDTHKLGIHWFVFGLALLLFNWPVLTIAEQKGLLALYRYLFGGWILVIVVLFLIARRSRAARPSGGGTDRTDHV